MKYIYWILGGHWRYEYYCLLKFRGWDEEVCCYYSNRAIKKKYFSTYRDNSNCQEFKEFLKSDWYKKCKL